MNNNNSNSKEGCNLQPSLFFKKSIPLIILLVIGILYYLMFKFLRIGIPCPLRLYSGLIFGKELYCPGCGITRMLDAEIRLSFKEAFLQNQMVFILQPFIYFEILKHIIHYYRGGNLKYTKLENVLLVVSIVCLVIFGIWRNIYAI